MTQHIQIVLEDGKLTVKPETASVWRDDQILMWSLGEGLSWPKTLLNPIAFNGGNGILSDWPGSVPVPVGNKPGDAGPDRRNYVAMCNRLMLDDERETYSYTIFVADPNYPDGDPVRVRVNLGGLEKDPDVENEPLP